MTFGCQDGSLPFTYLGLSVETTRPNIEHFEVMVHRVERRLISTSMFLSQADKLELDKSVLSSLPTYFLITLIVPTTVLKQIYKYRRHGLWVGSDINAKKPPKAGWRMSTKPRAEGGLGILNLRTWNDALLMKSLHKVFNKCNLPRVKLN
jgi:hypothetical protein